MRSAVPLRSALPKDASPQPVIFEVLARTGDSSRTQPGVPRGLRRTGDYRTRPMPVFDRFVPTLLAPEPLGYLVDAADTIVIARLRLHGIPAAPSAYIPVVDEFVVDSIVRASRPFQGHNEVRILGRWRRMEQAPRKGMLLIPASRLAMYLLDPESDDGFATWNLLDDRLRVGQRYPVLRVPDEISSVQ
jgi:hypothetical protein